MYDRMQTLDQKQLTMIHDASIDILNNTGLAFHDPESLDILRKNGHRTENNTVFFTEKDIACALETAPARFMIRARNPENSVWIGEDDFAFMPTGGAPFVAELNGRQRPATMDDFYSCCKLVQTSRCLNIVSSLMVQPNDLSPDKAHLDLMLSEMLLSDKPFTGSTTSKQAAMDAIDMAAMIWGGKKRIKEAPVMMSMVNTLSPLQFSSEQAGVVVVMARYRQPIAITSMILAGCSGPVSLSGLLALQNAEILAGVALAQLVNPGTPVLYGSTSCPTDMRTGTPALGAPETVKIVAATTQLARFYNLPCRTGGVLTDSHVPDAQALAEGTLIMDTAVRNGANLVAHACGQIASYLAMSFEKWLIDEELCHMICQSLEPMGITDESIDADTIRNIGVGGQYLDHPKTFEQFGQLSQPVLFNRKNNTEWLNSGGLRIEDVAAKTLTERLDGYEKPEIA